MKTPTRRGARCTQGVGAKGANGARVLTMLVLRVLVLKVLTVLVLTVLTVLVPTVVVLPVPGCDGRQRGISGMGRSGSHPLSTPLSRVASPRRIAPLARVAPSAPLVAASTSSTRQLA